LKPVVLDLAAPQGRRACPRPGPWNRAPGCGGPAEGRLRGPRRLAGTAARAGPVSRGAAAGRAPLGAQPEIVDPERGGEPGPGELRTGARPPTSTPRWCSRGQHVGEGDRRSGPVDRQPPDARPVLPATPAPQCRLRAFPSRNSLSALPQVRRATCLAGGEHAAHPGSGRSPRRGRGHVGLVGLRDGLRPVGEQFPGLVLPQPDRSPSAARSSSQERTAAASLASSTAWSTSGSPPAALGPAPPTCSRAQRRLGRRSRCTSTAAAVERLAENFFLGAQPHRRGVPVPGQVHPGTTCTGRRRPGAGTSRVWAAFPRRSSTPSAMGGQLGHGRSGRAPRRGYPSRILGQVLGRRGCPGSSPAASSTLASLRPQQPGRG